MPDANRDRIASFAHVRRQAMSSSVFKEFPSPGGGGGGGAAGRDVIDSFYTDDNHMNLEAGDRTDSNMLVIINRNGNYSAVDQARLHDLLGEYSSAHTLV